MKGFRFTLVVERLDGQRVSELLQLVRQKCFLEQAIATMRQASRRRHVTVNVNRTLQLSIFMCLNYMANAVKFSINLGIKALIVLYITLVLSIDVENILFLNHAAARIGLAAVVVAAYFVDIAAFMLASAAFIVTLVRLGCASLQNRYQIVKGADEGFDDPVELVPEEPEEIVDDASGPPTPYPDPDVPPPPHPSTDPPHLLLHARLTKQALQMVNSFGNVYFQIPFPVGITFDPSAPVGMTFASSPRFHGALERPQVDLKVCDRLLDGQCPGVPCDSVCATILSVPWVD